MPVILMMPEMKWRPIEGSAPPWPVGGQPSVTQKRRITPARFVVRPQRLHIRYRPVWLALQPSPACGQDRELIAASCSEVFPQAQAIPEAPPSGVETVIITRPVTGSTFWMRFPEIWKAQAATVRQLRLALDAQTVLEAILADLPHLTAAEHNALGKRCDSPGDKNERVRGVMEAHDGMRALLRRHDAEAARLAALDQAGRDRAAETARLTRQGERREAAALLLRRLAQCGVEVTLVRADLLARPQALLSPGDLAELQELRGEVAALLSEPPLKVA